MFFDGFGLFFIKTDCRYVVFGVCLGGYLMGFFMKVQRKNFEYEKYHLVYKRKVNIDLFGNYYMTLKKEAESILCKTISKGIYSQAITMMDPAKAQIEMHFVPEDRAGVVPNETKFAWLTRK